MTDNDISEAAMTSLRSRFQCPEIAVAPGCYDALSSAVP
jgi:hypothetical protein